MRSPVEGNRADRSVFFGGAAAAESRSHGVDGPRLIRCFLLELPASLDELRDLLVLAVAHRLPRLEHLVQLANFSVALFNLGAKLGALGLEHERLRLAALIALLRPVAALRERTDPILRRAQVIDALLERLFRAGLRRARLRRRRLSPPLGLRALLERVRELGEPRVSLGHRRLVHRVNARLGVDEPAGFGLVDLGAFGEVREPSRYRVRRDAERHLLRLGDGPGARRLGGILRREQRGGELVRGGVNLALRLRELVR